MTKRAEELVMLIRYCNPGKYLTQQETDEALQLLPDLLREELSTDGGHLGWFYMKLKASTDYHGYGFQIPEKWAHLYPDYQADLEIFKLTEPFLTVACLLRNFGLRRSFIQGRGNGSEYRK